MKKSLYYKNRINYTNKIKNLKNKYFIYIVLVTILIFLCIVYFTIHNRNNKYNLNIPIENVMSFKISSEDMITIYELAEEYDIEFDELLTYYSIENNFFDKKITDNSSIEKKFLINYETIKNKYDEKSVQPYYEIIHNILSEIQNFPISVDDDEDNYIYGDSFGAERTYGGNRLHMGTDIMDRENIVGRIPIISMTDGVIENIGWNEKGGYRVGIRTSNGNYYYYAHLDSFYEGLEKGQEVTAEQILGYMGNTGYSKVEGTKGNFEAHLHMGIEVETSLSKDPIWINPYPFLRYIENLQLD